MFRPVLEKITSTISSYVRTCNISRKPIHVQLSGSLAECGYTHDYLGRALGDAVTILETYGE
jgi:hypothetical protein